MPNALKAFQAVRLELTITTEGLFIRQHRIVKPTCLQQAVIKQAHVGQQGHTKTLGLLATALVSSRPKTGRRIY